MNMPKPTPPKVRLSTKVEEMRAGGESEMDIAKMILNREKELPPINLKSPDGKRVVEVRDPAKAESMAKKGWVITDDKKTPYVPAEHLTNKPFQEGLADLKRQMDKIERSNTYGQKPPPKRRPPYRKIKKENN